MNADALLIVTDGTSKNTATMLVTLSGATLSDWLPKSPQPANPIWASSPYQDGKHLVSKTYDNIIDTFTVTIDSKKMDTTIHEMRRFVKLLERAIKYWTSEYSTDKYWLEVRGVCETNIRYAYVIDHNLPEINNPFAPPFAVIDEDGSTLDELQFTIEHTIWTDNLTIGADCVKISDGKEAGLGGVNYSAFVPVAQDDDAYLENASAPVYSDNTDLYMGKSASGDTYRTGIRFKNVTIPVGCTIISAYMTFKCAIATAGTRCNLKISGEKVINPPAFSDFADLLGRVKTTANTLWSNLAAWVIPPPPVPTSPELKIIIQEIVNLPGWASGQDLVLLIDDNLSDTGAYRVSGDTTDVVFEEPTLHIGWLTTSTIYHGEETPTCLRAPAVVNYWNSLALTHAYWNRGAAWSNNLVNVGLANNDLLPAIPAVGDRFYACIQDNGVAFPGSPFTNLVIHLNTASVDITSVTVSISDGAGGWIAQPVNYNPNNPLLPSGVVGVNYLTWALQAGWGVDTYNGIAGYWIMFEVTGIGANPAPPVKETNYPIFSVMWPHIDIGDEEVHGDISAIINFLNSYTKGPAFTNLIISAKKYSRTNGGKFVPYIGFTLNQKAPHAYAYAVDIAVTEIQTSEAYLGWCYNWTEAGITVKKDLDLVWLEAKTYSGRFRVFLRTKINTGAADVIGLNLHIMGSVTGDYETPVIWNTGTGFQIFDFGLVAFPTEAILGDNLEWIWIYVKGQTTGACDIDKYDLVLIPVDDTCIEVVYDDAALFGTSLLDMDEPIKIITEDFKQGPYAAMLENNTPAGYFVIDWTYGTIALLKAIVLGSFNLDPDEEYWLIFFTYDLNMSAGESWFEYLIAPVLDKAQRYLLARGDE